MAFELNVLTVRFGAKSAGHLSITVCQVKYERVHVMTTEGHINHRVDSYCAFQKANIDPFKKRCVRLISLI